MYIHILAHTGCRRGCVHTYLNIHIYIHTHIYMYDSIHIHDIHRLKTWRALFICIF